MLKQIALFRASEHVEPETQTHTLSFKHKHNVSYFLSQRSDGFHDPKLPDHYIMSGETGHCEEERMYAWLLPFSISSLDIKLEMPFDLMTSSSSSKKAPSKQNKTNFPKLPKIYWVYNITMRYKRKLNITFSACSTLSNINSFNKQDVWHKDYMSIYKWIIFR